MMPPPIVSDKTQSKATDENRTASKLVGSQLPCPEGLWLAIAAAPAIQFVGSLPSALFPQVY